MTNERMKMDHSDGGFAADFARLLRRRRFLTLAGAAGLTACGVLPGQGEPNRKGTAADGSVCLKLPSETAGPFPADGTNTRDGVRLNILTQSGMIREDIRSSVGDGMTAVAAGAPVSVEIALVNVGNACAALAGRLVYIWHCDADGKYSLYDLTDRDYLRGAGITDAQGRVKFTTVFPGCYTGRWPHIHFEAFSSPAQAVSGDDSLLTSQFALPAEAARAIYASDAVYAASVANLDRADFAGDMIFRDNTDEQNVAMTLAISSGGAGGLKAAATVGVWLD